MTKEEWRAQIHNGCNVLVKILIVITAAPIVLVAAGMLWEKWCRPPQSWFLTYRRMTDLSVQMCTLSDRHQGTPTSLPRLDDPAAYTRNADWLASILFRGVRQIDDTTIRSRGAWLSHALELPESETFDRKSFTPSQLLKEGLVRDRDEWVLVDFWGEPYYVIVDANKDKQVINPQYEAAKIRPDRARQDSGKMLTPFLKSPWPLMHPWFIYSSGPDRDPQTWDDNMIAWESYR